MNIDYKINKEIFPIKYAKLDKLKTKKTLNLVLEIKSCFYADFKHTFLLQIGSFKV